MARFHVTVKLLNMPFTEDRILINNFVTAERIQLIKVVVTTSE